MKLEIYSHDGKLISSHEIDENDETVLREGPEIEENE